MAQQGRGLAAALTSVFAHFAAAGRSSASLPSTVTAHICRLRFSPDAFETLSAHDVVVGPTHDGGYYLVGAKAAHATLFDGDGMGTHSALDALLARARQLQLSVGFTDPFYDIDVEGDLTSLPWNYVSLRREPRERRHGWSDGNNHAVTEGSGRPVKLTPAHRLFALGHRSAHLADHLRPSVRRPG